ncbi:hypothetical protein ACFSNO_29240 [Streptomyces cirratus]
MIWAAEGAPVLAFETVVSGLQDDGTPSELHVVTDAKTARRSPSGRPSKRGTGNTMYSGQVTLGTSQSGSNFTLTDAGPGRPQDLRPQRRQLRHRHALHEHHRRLGQRRRLNRATAGADAHTTAPRSRGTSTRT